MGPALSSSIEFEDILSETTQPKHSTVFQKYMQKQYRTIEYSKAVSSQRI